MAGTRVSVIPKTFFNFSNVQAGQLSNYIVLANSLDVRAYREITLLVRIHSYTISQYDAVIAIAAAANDPSIEDPTSRFVRQPPAMNWATCNFMNSAPQPSLASTALMQDQRGAYLQILCLGMQGAMAGTLSA